MHSMRPTLHSTMLFHETILASPDDQREDQNRASTLLTTQRIQPNAMENRECAIPGLKYFLGGDIEATGISVAS